MKDDKNLNPKPKEFSVEAYCFGGAVDDGYQVDINHFAPSFFMFVEGMCLVCNTGAIDADVKSPEGILVGGKRGSQLI